MNKITLLPVGGREERREERNSGHKSIMAGTGKGRHMPRSVYRHAAFSLLVVEKGGREGGREEGREGRRT